MTDQPTFAGLKAKLEQCVGDSLGEIGACQSYAERLEKQVEELRDDWAEYEFLLEGGSPYDRVKAKAMVDCATKLTALLGTSESGGAGK